IGIERHQYLALDAADALHLGYVADALQRAFDDVVDEIGELLRCLAGRNRGIGDDWQADHVDALDQRLADVLRQVAADPGDGVLGETDPAEHQQDDGEDDGRKRMPDRPGGNVQCHQRTRPPSNSSANTVLIRSPSCNEVPASAATISPTSRPSRISVELSD